MDVFQNPILGTLLLALIKFVVVVFLFVMPLASLLTWMERRQSAYTQDRLGPWRAHFLKIKGKPVGLGGLLHIAADGLKMFFKEPFIPATADKLIFNIAPAIGFVTALMIVSFIPFGPDVPTSLPAPFDIIPLQITRLDAGILWIFALGSLGVYGASLAGWASNNRFALMGGLRAAAQSISYEIALGLTLVGAFMLYGTTELSAMVQAQSGATFFGLLPNWGIFTQPLGAVLFLTAAIAETKRGPFDLPEGESEIIGYFVEYSSMGFGLFMLTEFVEIVVLACLFTTVFLGGWQFAWLLGEHSLFLGFTNIEIGPWMHGILGLLFFGLKVFLMCAFQLQLRWTLPRFRYDQLMHLGWKILLPLSLANIAVTSVMMMLDVSGEWLSRLSVLTAIIFMFVVIAGPNQKAAPAVAHGHSH